MAKFTSGRRCAAVLAACAEPDRDAIFERWAADWYAQGYRRGFTQCMVIVAALYLAGWAFWKLVE